MRDPTTNPELDIPAFLNRIKDDRPKDGGHAVLAPSAAHRWIVCPGSVRLEASCPRDEGSTYAQEGTDAHQLAAFCLTDGSEAWEHINTEMQRGDGTKFTVSKDMADAVQVYLDWARANIIPLGPNNYRIETRFDLRDVVPGNWGTSDLCGYDEKNRTLIVADYKHGIGVIVGAEDNEQLQNYAAGVVHEMSSIWPDIAKVKAVIVQPRGFGAETTIREWETTVDALGEWVETVLKPAGERALKADAPIGPVGGHCQFCKAKTFCPRQREIVDAAIQAKPEAVPQLETFELATLLGQVAHLRKWIAALEDEAFRRMMGGEKVPGKKLVAKKSDRVWKDGAEAAAKAKWGDDAYSQPKLLTPAQMEKLRDGKAFCAEHAFKPDAGLTLADEDDKRPSVQVRTAAEVFSGVKA